jgi:hypothetical protein
MQTEDQQPAGDLRSGGEHEPFRAGIRRAGSGRISGTKTREMLAWIWDTILRS